MTNESDTPYVPIGCDQHSVLELLAMRRVTVALQARGHDGRVFRLHGSVRDVATRSGAEYLVLLDGAAAEHAVRLDRLLTLHDQAGTLLWRQKPVEPD